MKKTMCAALSAALFLSACASRDSQNTYSGKNVGVASNIEMGKVLKVRKIKIQRENTGGGATAGALGGAAAGVNFGDGKGALAALIGSVLVGAVAGGIAEDALNSDEGVEYTVKKDNKKIITVAQNIEKDDVPIGKGQRVMIQVDGGGYQRILPAD